MKIFNLSLSYHELYDLLCKLNLPRLLDHTDIVEIIERAFTCESKSYDNPDDFGSMLICNNDDTKKFDVILTSTLHENLSEILESFGYLYKGIDIKYFSDKIEELKFIDNKSDWIDLRAAEDVSLKAGEHKLIPLGVGMILPEGYEAHIVPRSSTFKNWGIIQTNHMGVIDESYCGDNDQWMMSVYATRDTEIKINDRICQFRIVEKQPPIKFNKVDHLMSTDRGGFGSTGKQ